MQAKMHYSKKQQTIYIVVVKFLNKLLYMHKFIINEQDLFKQLNFMLYGINISNKCYIIAMKKIKKNAMEGKDKIKKFQNIKQNGKQGDQFKKIFMDSSVKTNQTAVHQKNMRAFTSVQPVNNSKVDKLVNKIFIAIQKQTNKFVSLSLINKKNIQNVKIKHYNKQNQQKQRILNESLIQLQNSTLNKKQSQIKEVQIHFQQENASNKAMEKVINNRPLVQQDWYKIKPKPKIKRCYTINLPNPILI